MFERRVHEWSGEYTDEPVHIARADAEVVHVPTEQPGAEPRQPDANHEPGGAEQRVAHARAVASDGGGGEFRGARGDVHALIMGPWSGAASALSCRHVQSHCP